MLPAPDVAELFSPHSFADFLRAYRESQSLYISSRRRDRFRSLLSPEAIDELLASGFLRFPDCRLAKDGRDVPQNTYMAGDITAGVIDTDALYAGYQEGATIVINSLHRYWRPLTEFCRELERLLNVPVQANTYVTPAGSQGFGIHYDPHDVLVLQISGRKHWRLYDGSVVLPTEQQPYNRATTDIGRIRQQCTLRAGDLIYLPRGQLHEAFTSSEPSIHITVGLISLSWSEVLREAIQQLVLSDVALRKSLPPHHAGDDGATRLRRELSRLRRLVATRLPLESALAHVTDRYIARRPQCSTGRFSDLAQADRLDGTSTLVRRPKVRFRTWQGDRAVHLLFYRKKMSFPRFVAPSLKYLCRAAQPFRISEIPGALTPASKRVLCQALVREGFLQPLPAGSAT